MGYVVDDSCEPSSSSGTLSVGFHIIFLFVKAVNLLQQQAYQRALLQQREAYQRALLQQRAIGQAAAERRATEAQVYLYQWMILHVNV